MKRYANKIYYYYYLLLLLLSVKIFQALILLGHSILGDN